MESIKVYMTNEEKEPTIIGIPKVKKMFSKKMVGKDGTVIYFIEKDYGIKRGLMSKMNFKTSHPLDDTFCEITIEIERYGN